MKDIGKMMNKVVSVLKNGKMVQFLKDIIMMEKKMV